ncbi:hypothetical protein TRVL_03854 [Trypanosoma vivax]|nr:hypothetical protein TRVL_03854 [Trypanosoma vivax]
MRWAVCGQPRERAAGVRHRVPWFLVLLSVRLHALPGLGRARTTDSNRQTSTIYESHRRSPRLRSASAEDRDDRLSIRCPGQVYDARRSAIETIADGPLLAATAVGRQPSQVAIPKALVERDKSTFDLPGRKE